MALINCPSCKARVSDKAKTCSSCQFDFVTGTSQTGLTKEQLQNQEKMIGIKQRYSLQMQAMASLIVFLAGITSWYFIGEMGFTKASQFFELGIAALGGLWYLVTRIRLIAFKKSPFKN